MKKINIDALQRGDIVLTTSTEKESSVIKAVTFSDISHAMLCVSRGSVMDSTGEGVQARNIQKIFYPDSCAIYILRPKDPLPEDALNTVISYIRARVGTPYALDEAMAAIAKTGKGSSKQFCSRLVARAFAEAGVKLVKNPDFCTPAELKRSKLLVRVENPSVSADEAEVEAMQKHGDQTIKMREITMSLLEKAKTLAPQIENINDISKVSVQFPEHDEALAAALKESGYLDFWQEELKIYPWRYDPLKIVQLYHALPEKSSIMEYCHKTLLDEESGTFNHWKSTLEIISDLNKKYERKTLKVLHQLYMKLNLNHHLRVKSAKVLVDVYGEKSA